MSKKVYQPVIGCTQHPKAGQNTQNSKPGLARKQNSRFNRHIFKIALSFEFGLELGTSILQARTRLRAKIRFILSLISSKTTQHVICFCINKFRTVTFKLKKQINIDELADKENFEIVRSYIVSSRGASQLGGIF